VGTKNFSREGLRVAPWGELQKEDYDFRDWMKGANEEMLNAGCLYEYARESHFFRDRLVTGRDSRKALSLIEFERNSAGYVHLIESGWAMWLDGFALELIANKSFAEVLRIGLPKVEKSLELLPSYFVYPKAVELPGQFINIPGLQKIEIEIYWPGYTDKEIGEEMGRFAAANRPQDIPSPDRRGQKRASKVRSFLKALSVMRICKHEPDKWKRLKLVALVCGYQGCKKELKEHKKRCKRGHAKERIGSAARTEISGARKQALRVFQLLFPWGQPTNY
jgi:hypothetical protein